MAKNMGPVDRLDLREKMRAALRRMSKAEGKSDADLVAAVQDIERIAAELREHVETNGL